MTTDRHEVIAGRLEEYAFGHLTSDARRDVEAHVRTCTVCAAALQQLEAVMAAMAQTPQSVVPAAALRDRVLSAIAIEPQEIAGQSRHVRVRRVRRSRSGWGLGWLAAAAAVIIAAGLVYSIDSSRREAEVALARARETALELQQRLTLYTSQTDLVVSILTAGDTREIRLAAPDTAGDSAARAYWSPTRGLVVVADRLPLPPPGRIYQVWLIQGPGPVSAGLLTGETAGRGFLIAPPPRADATGPVTIAVTDEPPGGLPAPTGSIRLAGSI